MVDRIRRRQPQVSTEVAIAQIALYKELGIKAKDIIPVGVAISTSPHRERAQARRPGELNGLVLLASDPRTQRSEFIEAVTNPTLDYGTANYVSWKYGAFLSSADTVRLCGLYMGPSQADPARDVLLEQGLSVRFHSPHLTYPVDYLPLRDLGFAYEALNIPQFEKYRKNPISRIGPQMNFEPSTTDFVRGKDFKALGQLMRGFGLTTRNCVLRIDPEDFFGVPESPVPIYRYGTLTMYPASQEEALRKFVEQRKRQLGL